MNPNETDSIRESLVRFCQRRGHGALQTIVKASGLSRNTVIRFRDGGVSDARTAQAIFDALVSITPRPTTISPLSLFAAETFALAMALNSPDLTDDLKTARAREFLASHRDTEL